MPVVALPLRLDRIQRGLFEVFSEASGVSTHWGYSEVLQGQLGDDFIALRMIGGPGPHIRRKKQSRTLQPIESVTLTVDAATAGNRVGVQLNDFNYYTDVIGGDTVDTVRDRLVASIEDESNESETATAAAGGAGELDISADFAGGITSLAIYGDISAGAPTLSSDVVLLTETTHTALVNVQAYSKSREPRNGAWSILARCEAALTMESFTETLRAYGVGVWGSTPPIDLSNIAEGHWETRASFDLTVAARSRAVQTIDTIDTINVDITTATPASSSTITVVQP